MKSLVDEIIRNKKDNRGIVKKYNEQGVMRDMQISIPDISELKKVHQKPMVIRKMDNFLDLVHKEELDGEELAIVLNHIIDNVGINNLSDNHKEIIGDKLNMATRTENKGGNEELRGKHWNCPAYVRNCLSHAVKRYDSINKDGKQTEGYKRAKGILGTNLVEYAQMKRIKNWFDTFDGDHNDMEYRLNGGKNNA